MPRSNHPRFDGFLRGAVGSLAGLAAMGAVLKATRAVSSAVNGKVDGSGPDPLDRHDGLDDISVAGIQSRAGEPATETVGRLAYEAVKDEDPDAALRQKLGQAVHWGYGVLIGGAYGALRAGADGADLPGGLGFGTAAWLIGDELVVPLLGLAEGPTAHPWSDHATALGAHLAYGAATSTATHALKRVM